VNLLILIQYCYHPYFYVYTWSNLENIDFWLILRRLKFWNRGSTTVATSSKVSWSKELEKKVIKRQTQILAEICQNRTADKGRIFEGFSVAQIKKCSTNKSLDITWGIYTTNGRSKIYIDNFHKFIRCSTENCFRTTTSPNLASLKLEASLGTTTK
jgi:hypothetical protein